ncbi:hypothetical protein MN116_006550 [Schistosoma mekongi]|uniref:2-(3-amino-3-carboxypropyl)histidine synthase subunit 2 n=1 Tax=Schistosoma mekongi TaxID=38744 RepID=A0AAE1Z8U7_SCHME|nr:hypothetical protein MN116_006550 [Schistosoma mekongi]
MEKWNINSPDIPTVFEINETGNWIRKNEFTKVGLQFPDELLGISVVICKQLNDIATSCLCVILGDSSFASCCVDEIAGQHMRIDALVHYGRACLSKTTGRLPIYYVFGKYSPCLLRNESELFRQIPHDIMQKIVSYSEIPPILLIIYDFRFKDVAQYICKELMSISASLGHKFPHLIWSEPATEASSNGSQLIRCGRLLIPYQSDCNISNRTNDERSWMMLYIGHTASTNTTENNCDLLSVYRILLSCPEVDPSKTVVFDPVTCDLDLSGLQVSKLLKRRSYLVERAKDAQYIGILVCTLSNKDYQSIIDRLKELLKRAKRSCITLFVGRLNPAKLANLPELQLLILIACPETSLLDSRDIHIPIVTPYEMECALKSCNNVEGHYLNDDRTWTAEKCWVDFRDLLPGGRAYVPLEEVTPALTESLADISLVNGHSRSIPRTNSYCSMDNSQPLVVQQSSELIESSHWDFNMNKFNRTWYGLDQEIGQTPVAHVKDGRIGLPTKYSHENQIQSSD